jgi:hypothetical protein
MTKDKKKEVQQKTINARAKTQDQPTKESIHKVSQYQHDPTLKVISQG